MARYKHIDVSPRFLAVDLKRQLLPGTFEHALDHLLDHEIDLSVWDARYQNDETGASAYVSIRFQGAQRDCVPCSHRDRCLRTPAKTRPQKMGSGLAS